MLNNVREGTAPQETKNAATVQGILTNYGWAQVLKAEGDAKGAKEKLDKAIALRDGAAEAKIKLPVLPAELGPTPGQAPPATQPTSPPATAPAAPQDTPEAAEVRTVLNKYLEAMASANADEIKAVVQVESGQEADFDAQLKMLADLAKLKEAVTTKISPEAAAPIAMMANAGNVLRTLPITVTGDDATVEIPNIGQHKIAVRQDGQWKMYFGAPENDVVKAQRAAAAKLGEALPQLISDVESGTITDAQGLQAAIAKAVAPQ
jgi:hypothetical protein